MRISTNFISCSVLLLATIMVKGAQATCTDAICAIDCQSDCPAAACSIDIDCAACPACAPAADPDTCVDPTAVTGVNANATVLAIDGFEATVTCAAGYYDVVGNLGTPIACSSDNTSWTYTGSCTGWTDTAATDCEDGSFWTAGSTTADSTCVACTTGKFSAGNNDVCAVWTDAAATDCEGGSFWTAGSTTADSTCVAFTDAAATDCEDGSFWTAGSTTADSTCVACTAGKFSAGNNDVCAAWTDAAATDCEDGSFWTAGSTTADSTCVACTAGEFSASDNDACATWSEPTAADCADGSVWTAGSTIANSKCVECAAGTFSAGNNDACRTHTPCAAGKYTTAAGSTAAQPSCTDCTVGTFRIAGATSSSAVETDSDVCIAHTPCAAGENTTVAGTTTEQPQCAAIFCNANHHVVSNVCTACGGGLTNPAGDDASGSDTLCGCAANEYVKDNVCTPCRAGTKNDAGDDSTAGDTTCTAVECPANSNGSDVSEGCECDPGFSGGVTATSTDPFYTSTCAAVACPVNTNGNDVSDGCECDPGFSGGVVATSTDPFYTSTCVAVACPVNTNGNDVSDGCECDPGFSGGVVATSTDPFYTSTCAAVSCPADSTGADVPSVCKCDPGFSGEVTATSTDLFYTSTCTAISCGENENVKGNACVTCPTGTDNAAGDDASKADTMCDGTPTRSYADLGWRGSSCNNPAASTVGGASRLAIGDKKKACYAGKTFKQAESICYEAGARLCTYDEIEAGATTGTGCNYDREHVWTSTKGDCEAGQHVTLLGKGGGKCNAGKLDSKKRCDADSYVAKGVRCCADNVVSDPPHHISKVTVEIKAGSDTVVMADVTGIKADDQLRITNPNSGDTEARTVLSITTGTARSRSQRSPTAPTPGTVTVDKPFETAFPLGSTIAISTRPTLPPPAFVWKTIRGCCRERVENSKRGLNHHGTASTETFFGSLDSVLINCTAACATDAVCTAVEVTKKNRAAAKCEFHVERMNAGDRSTKSCKKATCMVKTGFVAAETALPPAPPTADPTAAPSPAAHSPTEWNERRGCCREYAGNKKYLNHVGTNIIITERTYAAATKACKDECNGRSTCTAVETRRNQRKKVYMCELHTASGINASSRASKSCKKALCAVKV